jgi:hypothetical protein
MHYWFKTYLVVQILKIEGYDLPLRDTRDW